MSKNPNKLLETWQQEDESKISAAIEALLQHEHGKKFLWWLLGIGRVGGQPFAGNSLQTSFNCGELNVGQQILDRIISVNPDGYITMMKDMQNERSTRDTSLRAHNAGTGGDTHEPYYGSGRDPG